MSKTKTKMMAGRTRFKYSTVKPAGSTANSVVAVPTADCGFFPHDSIAQDRHRAGSIFCYRLCYSTTRIDNRPDSHARAIVAIRVLLVTTWIGIWIGIRIRVIEWKRREEGKPEVVDNNDTVVVMKPVSMEVVEPVESGCAV